MTVTPLITTIIPTYRRPRLLGRAIRSVLGQTYPNIRVCVYDNASGDETEAVVAAIIQNDPRVRYCKHSRNIGYIENFIYGLGEVTTPYFSILSDDDLLTPWFYEKALEGLNQYPQAKFSALDVVKINENNSILAGRTWVGKKTSEYFGPGEAFDDVVKGKIPVPWVGTVYRREVLEEIGLPKSDAGPMLNDDFVLRAAARYPCVVNPAIGCLVTEGSESVGAGMYVNADWPQWWNVIIEGIVNDSENSNIVRQQAWGMRKLALRKIALRQVFKGLGNFGRCDSGYASRAASGIGDCGFPVTSVFLRLCVALYDNFILVQKVLDWYFARRKINTSAQRETLTRQYAPLIDYLQSIDKSMVKSDWTV